MKFRPCRLRAFAPTLILLGVLSWASAAHGETKWFLAQAMDVAVDDPFGESEPPAAAEYLEVTFRGQVYRIPVDTSLEQGLPLGETGLELRMGAGVTADRDTAAPDTAAPGRAGPPAEAEGGNLGLVIALVLVTLAALAGVAIYLLIIDPLRRRRPLSAALEIIRRNAQPQFRRAEELLDQALLAGMRKRDIEEARFFLAYVRARLGRYDEAATVLADLEKGGGLRDQATLYLSLWVYSRLGRHEKIERLYSDHGTRLQDFLDTRLIAGIALLKLARLHRARKEISLAMHYYDQLRRLDVLVDEIPSHLDDHEVVLGTMALFERNHDQAVKHFSAAVDAARQNHKSTIQGELGLLLCQWRMDPNPDIDEPLGKLLTAMESDAVRGGRRLPITCPHCGRSYRVLPSYVGRSVQCKGCRRRFVAEQAGSGEAASESGGQFKEEQLLDAADQLLRDARLWHAVSLLFRWRARAALSGLATEDLDGLQQRLDRVTLLDTEMGDPYLISGLIRYYSAETEPLRQDARQRLDRATQCGVHVPEVLQLLERENKLAAVQEHSLNFFHQLAVDYGKNPEIALERRRRFKDRMERFARFRALGEVDLGRIEDQTTPSIRDLQNREAILHHRITTILRHRLQEAAPEDRERIQAMLDQLDSKTRQLTDETSGIELLEQSLMEATGEFLFEEEPQETSPIAEGAQGESQN